MDVPTEVAGTVLFPNGSALGLPTGAARMGCGLQKVQVGTSNAKSCINTENRVRVYFWMSLYCFFPTTQVLGPLPSHRQHWGGMDAPGGAFSSVLGHLNHQTCHSCPKDRPDKDGPTTTKLGVCCLPSSPDWNREEGADITSPCTDSVTRSHPARGF